MKKLLAASALMVLLSGCVAYPESYSRASYYSNGNRDGYVQSYTTLDAPSYSGYYPYYSGVYSSPIIINGGVGYNGYNNGWEQRREHIPPHNFYRGEGNYIQNGNIGNINNRPPPPNNAIGGMNRPPQINPNPIPNNNVNNVNMNGPNFNNGTANNPRPPMMRQGGAERMAPFIGQNPGNNSGVNSGVSSGVSSGVRPNPPADRPAPPVRPTTP